MGTSWIVGTRNESTSTGGNYGANAEANADCAINRFPSMFVSSFVTLIGFDWLKTFIRYFVTFTGHTDLVRKVKRLADPRITRLKTTNDYIEGLKPGNTEVQVLSPMLGHVLADKVYITGLSVRLIAGLSSDPDLDIGGGQRSNASYIPRNQSGYDGAL